MAPGATMTPQPGGGFANTGDCASFAAQGGALVTPTPDVPPPAPEI